MNFIGIVLGGDMNSYAVARAFYEEYKIKTIVIGKYPLYPTKHSKLIEPYYYSNIMDDNVLIEALSFIDKKYENKKKILLGNTDYYVKHILKNRKSIEKISDNFIIPMTSLNMFEKLFDKSNFYALCEKYNLNYPKSVIFDFSCDDILHFKIPFTYPIFIKPSNTVIYEEYSFDTKQKGYKVENYEELKKIIFDIKDTNFNDKFIFQEYIDGNESFVYTIYTTKNNKVAVVSAGKILMEDRSPKLIGNYNAITNAYNKDISIKLKNFLEDIKFTGVCHFDIRYSKKRDKYYIFECNIRQGRSNYYNLAQGVNLAKYIVDDYIYNKSFDFKIANKEFIVSLVPKFALKNNKSKVKNFHRFTLAPYDMNIKRLYYQARYDIKILREYKEYNKEDVCAE